MLVLSIQQPWAGLILAGIKKYETRSWTTSYRGPLGIHASRTIAAGIEARCRRAPLRSLLILSGLEDFEALPRGTLLGQVELVDVVPTNDLNLRKLSRRQRALGDFRPGRFCWILERPRLFSQPVQVAGRLGLFNVPLEAGNRDCVE